jgi:hypothetical protein
MKENKRMYTAPAMEIIPVEPGMVMALSGKGLGIGFGVTDGDDLFKSTYTRSTATHSDVESMINDILTVGQ